MTQNKQASASPRRVVTQNFEEQWEAAKAGLPPEPPVGLFDDDDPSLIEYKPGASNAFKLTPIGDILRGAIDMAVARMNGSENPIPVAHPERAEGLGGGYWTPGLHFVVAGTGAGKSQLVIEDILCAAKAGFPCLYIGLELEAFQVALRFLAEEAHVSWSKLYLGRCSQRAIDKAEEVLPSIASLPLYLDFSGPMGWPASRLRSVMAAMRVAHPTGPILIVLDYLQLIAEEPLEEWRQELRERIGKMAYQGRTLSVEFKVALLVVSSTARNNYALLSGDAIKAAGITMARRGDDFSESKIVQNPDVLVGAGKESGEIEASADSVTVLLKWPTPLDDGTRIVLAVCAKVRAVGASWSALLFDHGTRFRPFTVNAMADLPELPGKGGRERVMPSEIEDRLHDTVRRLPQLRSKSALIAATDGNKSALHKSAKDLFDRGILIIGERGIEWVDSVEAEPQEHDSL